MNEAVREYLEKFPSEVRAMYAELRELLYGSVPREIGEQLWARLPSYTVGESFVRLIPFKDHINLEARAVVRYAEELKEYKITPKGMLQLYAGQKLPLDVLERIFRETFVEEQA